MFKKEDTIYIDINDGVEEAIVKKCYKKGKYKVLVTREVNDKGEVLVSANKVYSSKMEYYDKKIKNIDKELEAL